MNALSSVFPNKPKVLLVVVHVQNYEQALRNVEIAINSGADGIFLINHDISGRQLWDIYKEVREGYPSLWVGVNDLDSTNEEAVRTAGTIGKINALWLDDAGYDEDATDPCNYLRKLRLWQAEYLNQPLIFGGVAFKYREVVRDPARAARLSIPFVDVVTTSGPGTGKAPDVGKISSMKVAIDDHALAIASGITPENVGNYLPHADCFIVATGISDSHTELNPDRVLMLSHIIEAWQP